MNLYEEVINKWREVDTNPNLTKLELVPADKCLKGDDREMIFVNDMAFELGGDNKFAKGQTVITDDASVVSEDAVYLLGPDLKDIKHNIPFARLTLVRVNEQEMGEADALYNQIQKIEFARYHVHPTGFMMRISAAADREGARVSKEAIANNLSLAMVGSMLIEKLRENPKVEAVKVIYITDETFDFESLDPSFKKAKEITKTIDHIFKDIKMDCQVCGLKQVCDEVEGLRELHFAQNKQ